MSDFVIRANKAESACEDTKKARALLRTVAPFYSRKKDVCSYAREFFLYYSREAERIALAVACVREEIQMADFLRFRRLLVVSFGHQAEFPTPIQIKNLLATCSLLPPR